MAFDAVPLANLNNLVVSLTDQADALTAATLDENFKFAPTYIDLDPQGVKTDAGDANGFEEATKITKAGNLIRTTLNATDLSSKQAAWMHYYGLGGTLTTTTPSGGGKKHVYNPVANTTRTLPYFTMGYREANPVEKMQHIGCVANSLNVNMAGGQDSFLTCSMDVVGLGKYSVDPVRESIATAYNDATTTLSNSVYVMTTTRDAVQMAIYDDGTNYVDVTARVDTISTVTLTWLSGGPYPTAGSGSGSLHIIYRTATAESGWAGTVDLAPTLTYSPFKMSQLVTLGIGDENSVTGTATAPTWAASAAAMTIDCEFLSLNWTLNNNVTPKLCPNQTVADPAHHHIIRRGARTQTVTVSREAINAYWRSIGRELDYISIYAKFQGPLIGGSDYEFIEFFWPKLQTPKVTQSQVGDYNADTMALIPMEDTAGTYPTVIVAVQTDSTATIGA